MTFIPKNWKNHPSEDTPISAEALIDLEERLSDYTDEAVDDAIANQYANVVNALPSSPSEGQFVRYRRFAGQPTWNLIYDSEVNSGMGGWVPVNKVEVTSHVSGSIVYNRNTTAGTWQAISGGPLVIVPEKGSYSVSYGLVAQLTGSSTRVDERWGLLQNATTLYPVGSAGNFHAQWAMSTMRGYRPSHSFNKDDLITMRHSSSNGTGISWNLFEMFIKLELRYITL
jgi:hypothetical protein